MTVETIDAGAAAPANETPVAAVATPAPETPAVDAGAATEKKEPAKASLDQELRGVWDKLHQPRENGKFAKREGAPETPAEGDAGAAEAAAAPQPGTTKLPDQPKEAGKTETPAQAASIDPPNSWSAEKKALWASVPPEAQSYIAQREAEAHQAITRAGGQVKTFEPIRNVIEHYGETFRKANLHPAEGIDRLLDVERQLQTDAPSAIKRIAEAYKVDLHRLIGQPPAASTEATPGTEGLPPIVSTLQTQLAETRAELTKVTSYLTAQQRTQIEGENAALARQIADFAKDKPHFDTVRKHMAGLMQSGAAETLDDAYDQAVHAHKGIRQRIQDDQRKADEDKAAKERAQKAADARKSSVVNVKSGPGSGNAPKTMDDTLREVAAKAYAK